MKCIGLIIKNDTSTSFWQRYTLFMILKKCNLLVGSHYTMLQKISNCEVKAWLCWNFIILSTLRFYVKSNFGKLKRSKNVIFANFTDSELLNLVNLGHESGSNLLKSNFRTSRIAKIDIFWPLECTQIGFHIKSELW